MITTTFKFNGKKVSTNTIYRYNYDDNKIHVVKYYIVNAIGKDLILSTKMKGDVNNQCIKVNELGKIIHKGSPYNYIYLPEDDPMLVMTIYKNWFADKIIEYEKLADDYRKKLLH